MQHHRVISRIACGCFLAALALTAMGCGSGAKVTVTGEVTHDGKPLPEGRITFHTSDGPVQANINNGKYTAENVPVGDASVTVHTLYIREAAEGMMKGNSSQFQAMQGIDPKKLNPEARKRYDEMKKKAQDAAKKVNELKAKYRLVNRRFIKPDTSGLKYTVKEEGNTFNAAVTSK